MDKSKRNILIIGLVILLVVGAFVLKRSQDNLAPQADRTLETTEVEGSGTSEVVANSDENQMTPEEEKAFALYDMEGLALDDLKSYGVPLALTFGTKSCIYCEQMKPDLARLNTEFMGDAIIKYVDMDVYPEFSAQWPIQGTPATVYFNGDGSPYSPTEDKYDNLIYKFKSAEDPDGAHAISMSFGKIPYDDLKAIIGDLND